MPRPKGARNLTPEERQMRKKGVKKATRKAVKLVPPSRMEGELHSKDAEKPKAPAPAPEAERVIVPPPAEDSDNLLSQDPVLRAIQGLADKFDTRLSSIEERLNAVETGQPTVNPVTGDEYTPPQAMGAPPSVGTTIVDNESPLPTHDPKRLRQIEMEADALTKSYGLDKVDGGVVVGGSRDPIKGRYDVRCKVCNKAPAPPGMGGRGVLPCDLNEKGEWTCENCFGGK